MILVQPRKVFKRLPSEHVIPKGSDCLELYEASDRVLRVLRVHKNCYGLWWSILSNSFILIIYDRSNTLLWLLKNHYDISRSCFTPQKPIRLSRNPQQNNSLYHTCATQDTLDPWGYPHSASGPPNVSSGFLVPLSTYKDTIYRVPKKTHWAPH